MKLCLFCFQVVQFSARKYSNIHGTSLRDYKQVHIITSRGSWIIIVIIIIIIILLLLLLLGQYHKIKPNFLWSIGLCWRSLQTYAEKCLIGGLTIENVESSWLVNKYKSSVAVKLRSFYSTRKLEEMIENTSGSIQLGGQSLSPMAIPLSLSLS